jgi:hypothetical protein
MSRVATDAPTHLPVFVSDICLTVYLKMNHFWTGHIILCVGFCGSALGSLPLPGGELAQREGTRDSLYG